MGAEEKLSRRDAVKAGVAGVVGIIAGLAGGYVIGYSASSPSGIVTERVTETKEITKEITTTVFQLTSTIPLKERVVFGYSAPLSGIFSSGLIEGIHGPYQLWAEEINRRGGLYVPEYGKILPVELKFYDDKSDPETAIRIYERLITQDEVDILLTPYTTTLHLAIKAVSDKYKVPLIASTSGKLEFEKQNAKYVRTLSPANEDTNPRRVVEFLSQYKDQIKTVAIAYAQHPFPAGHIPYFRELLEKEGFDLVLLKDYAPDTTDFSPLLLELKNTNADALLALTYVADSFVFFDQLIRSGYNPKVVYGLVGPYFSAFREKFGKALEGVMVMGFWVPHMNPESEYLYKRFLEKFGIEPDVVDFPLSYAQCQVWEQAIQKAGLSWDKLMNVLDTEEFHTLMGNTAWKGNIAHLNTYAWCGIIQWQGGRRELVWPPGRATAAAIVPKPKWPAT